jgi:hypothetical protein
MWGKEEFIEWCTRNERSGIAWLKAGIWSLRALKREIVKRICILCLRKEGHKHIHTVLSFRKPSPQKIEGRNFM